MIQLDRLEVLTERYLARPVWFVTNDSRVHDVMDALPDLIRVARAAKDFLEDGTDLDGERLEKALALLYREVEP